MRVGKRFLLLTVTDPSDSARGYLAALLDSLERQRVEVDLVLVLRGAGPRPRSASPLLRIHALDAPLAIGLSHARNRALEYARAEGLLGAADVVAFPDDDCRYPDGVLAKVAASIDRETEIVCGPYAPGPGEIDRKRFPLDSRQLSPTLVMQVISSNNVFLAARVVAAVGEFDERFGLGAVYGASEDSDYLLRALRQGVRGVYRPSEVFVEHPYKAELESKYYRGTLAVLAKHARHSRVASWLLVRRLVFGIALVVRRAIAPHEYGRAVWTASRLLIARP